MKYYLEKERARLGNHRISSRTPNIFTSRILPSCSKIIPA